MVSLCVQNLAICNTAHLPKTIKKFQNEFKVLPNCKWIFSKWPKFYNIAPKWWDFAKSGHTAWADCSFCSIQVDEEVLGKVCSTVTWANNERGRICFVHIFSSRRPFHCMTSRHDLNSRLLGCETLGLTTRRPIFVYSNCCFGWFDVTLMTFGFKI